MFLKDLMLETPFAFHFVSKFYENKNQQTFWLFYINCTHKPLLNVYEKYFKYINILTLYNLKIKFICWYLVSINKSFQQQQ